MANLVTVLKFIAAALVVAFLAFVFIQHKHDTTTIAGQKQLLAQADTQKNLDAATIAQLRSDLDAQSGVIGQLGAKADAAVKAAQVAQLAAVRANAPLQVEVAHIQQKNATPQAKGKTCEDAISEWRARQ